MNIREEELEHIITQFGIHNMYSDMAMLFITQDIQYEDIFRNSYVIPFSFYKKVFTYMWLYIVDKINKGQIDLVIRDIFMKLKCNEITNKKYDEAVINMDYFSGLIIKHTLLTLVKRADYNGVNFIIDILHVNPNINNRVIYQTLSSNQDLCHQYVITNIISGEYLDIEDIFKLIMIRAEDVPDDTLREICNEIFNNKNMMLLFAAYIYSLFVVDMIYKSKDSYIVRLNCKLKGKDKQLVERMRNLLIEYIWIDAELDYYDFLVEAHSIHKNSKNIYMAQLYQTYIKWFGSTEREKTSLSNMIHYGYEESLSDMQIDINNCKDLSRDIVNLSYITSVEGLDGYDLFIKMFNLNRFFMGYFNNTYTVEKRFNMITEYEELPLTLALDVNFYIFLCFR